jgi:hypothetical protein
MKLLISLNLAVVLPLGVIPMVPIMPLNLMTPDGRLL